MLDNKRRGVSVLEGSGPRKRYRRPAEPSAALSPGKVTTVSTTLSRPRRGAKRTTSAVKRTPKKLPKPTPRHKIAVKTSRLLSALGETLRRLRKAKGLTQQDAAERADLDLRHYKKIEAGEQNFNLGTLAQLARGFGVEAFKLVARPARRSAR